MVSAPTPHGLRGWPAASRCTRLGAAAFGLLLLAACEGSGASYRPIVDGPMGDAYEADLSQCQQLAEQRGYASGEAATNTGISAAVGAAVGAITGGLSGAATGAGIGAVGGAGGSALSISQQRKQIVINCMQGRGYRVLG